MATRPILLYDSQCPLCRKEIRHYQRIDRQQKIDWQDLFAPDLSLTRFGITHEAAMKVIHCVDRQGQVHRGVAAFLIVWELLPGYRHLARIIIRLRLQGLLDRCYYWFAARRYRRRCRSGYCMLK